MDPQHCFGGRGGAANVNLYAAEELKGTNPVLQFCRPQVFTAPAVDNDRKAKPPCIDIFPGLKLTCEAFEELPDKPGQQAAFYFYIGSTTAAAGAKDSTLNTFKTKLGNQAQKSSLDDWVNFPAGTKTWRKLRYTGSQEFCVKDKGGTETFQTMPGVFTVYVLEESGQVVIVAFRAPLEPRTAGGTRPVGASGGRQRCQKSSLDALREEVCNVNRRLPAAGLVTMHSGNASGLDRQSGRLLIKPSGVDYNALSAGDLVEVELESGRVTGGKLRPSVDLPHHLFLYRRLPDVCGIIHTHSNYATAFAAAGRPIPLCLTAIADELGARSPAAPTRTTKATTSPRRSCGTAIGRRRSCWPTTAYSPGAIRRRRR